MTPQQQADAILARTPTARYAYTQKRWDAGMPDIDLYRVSGGLYDGSDVTADTLIELGISVPGERS